MSKGTYSQLEQPGLSSPRRKPTTLPTGTEGGVSSLGFGNDLQDPRGIHVARGRPCAPRMHRDSDRCGAQGRPEAKHRGQRNRRAAAAYALCAEVYWPQPPGRLALRALARGEAGAAPYHSSFRTPKKKGDQGSTVSGAAGCSFGRADGGDPWSLFERKKTARSASTASRRGAPSALPNEQPAAQRHEANPTNHKKPQLPMGANATTLYATAAGVPGLR